MAEKKTTEKKTTTKKTTAKPKVEREFVEASTGKKSSRPAVVTAANKKSAMTLKLNKLEG